MSGHAATESEAPSVSIVILTKNEAENLRSLVPQARAVFDDLEVPVEFVVVDDSTDGTDAIARELGCTVIEQQGQGYGAALGQGLAAARGAYVITIDADHSHEPGFLYHMWSARGLADVVIGSRYVSAGRAEMPLVRAVLSRVLNRVFSFVLDLDVHDLSSGYRLYRREVLASVLPLEGRDYDALEEVLVKAHCEGWRIREVPIWYRPRHAGRSNAKAIRFARSYLQTLGRLWRIRSSASSCDYDSRAFDSWILPQRWWQRQRFRIVTELIRGRGRCLDVGPGSSRIIQSLPGMVGLEPNRAKLRFLHRTNPWLAAGSAYALPFRDESFAAVVSSQVIEHIPKHDDLFLEMHRVLRPGGTLVLGTPDYDSRLWVVVEWLYGILMPNAYADEHISHYTHAELVETLGRHGFEVVSASTVFFSELVLEARKVPRPAAPAS